jgi:hypothetical protein
MQTEQVSVDPDTPGWKRYEAVAAILLDGFAQELRLPLVEGKQEIPGLKSGASWEIDAV